ncbi:MAG: YbhB/YbcL family Raf kinase inhibitor-like protein [Actinobacteria bacterium]|nr:YbhB/YbcL family Raf kinase inhibitor-like protein [Actinomycetota bacterium]
MAEFRLTSPAVQQDQGLPERFSADGGNVSPPLQWTGAPDGTTEFLLICDDPDAESGVFTHWIVYGIAASETQLPEGVPQSAVVDEPVELMQGLNEFDEAGYTGPMADEIDEPLPHRYFFRLFALDEELDLPPGARRDEIRAATSGHVLAMAELVVIA